MNNTIRFPKPNVFYAFLDELKQAYDEKRLSDFICIYSSEYPEGKKPEGFTKLIDRYWFGQKDCIYMLGLVDTMKDEIREFIKKKNREAEEGEI